MVNKRTISVAVLSLIMAVSGTIGNVYAVSLDPSEVKFIAHRGLASEAPENTMLAFEKAVEAGYWGIETDVQVTLDEQFVLAHEVKLRELCGVNKYINKLTKEEVQKYPIVRTDESAEGKFKMSDFDQQFIPSLEDFLLLCKENDVVPVLESKWGINKITSTKMTFKDGNEIVTVIKGNTSRKVSDSVELPVLIRDGYRCRWNSREEGDGRFLDEMPQYYPNYDETYYAIWEESETAYDGSLWEQTMPAEEQNNTTTFLPLFYEKVKEVYGTEKPVILHCFHPEALREIKTLMALDEDPVKFELELIYNGKAYSNEIHSTEDAINICQNEGFYLALQYGMLNASLAKRIRSLGIHLDAWSVDNNRGAAERCISMDVDTLTTSTRYW